MRPAPSRAARALVACGLAAVSILLASCTITDSEGVSADDVRQAFGGSPTSTANGTNNQSSSSPSRGGPPAAKQTGNLANASATAPEPASDALRAGTTPPYADITAAEIRGQGRSVRFTLTFASTLPDKMPDASTTMSAGYRLKIGDVPYVLTANASTEGWRLSATRGGETAKHGGTLRVEGTTLTIDIPWSFLSGPRSFTWTGYLAWNQSSPVMSYVVDILPNNGEAAFPSS
jgi:hypothetical protein